MPNPEVSDANLSGREVLGQERRQYEVFSGYRWRGIAASRRRGRLKHTSETRQEGLGGCPEAAVPFAR